MAALLLLVTIFFWGTAFRATAIAAEDTSPIMVTALRAAPAAVVLLAAAILMRRRLPGRELWLPTVVTGLVMVPLAIEGISEGAARAGAANAAVITNLSPFVVLVLARAFLGERTSPLGILGLLAGFGGVVLMVSSQLGGVENGGDFALGIGFSILGAIAWGTGVLVTKGLFTRHPGIDMVGFTAAQYLVGGAASLALAFAIDGAGGTEWGSGDLWGAVAWIAIGTSALATLTFFGALKRMSATTVSAWGFLAPVVAVVTEIVYGNTPGGLVLAGMGLAIAGVAVVNVAPRLADEPGTEGRQGWLASVRAR